MMEKPTVITFCESELLIVC